MIHQTKHLVSRCTFFLWYVYISTMSALDSLFGPLGKEYCYYFYALSLFGLVSLAILLFSAFMMMASRRRGATFYLQLVSAAVLYGMLYLQNRLLFNMCKV